MKKIFIILLFLSQLSNLIASDGMPIERSSFITHARTYQDHSGTYDILKIQEYVTEKSPSVVELSTRVFLPLLLEDSWGDPDGERSTNLKRLMQDPLHQLQIERADLSFPIILSSDSRVIDGLHRIFKALRDNISSINAVFLDKYELKPFLTEGPPLPSISGIPDTPLNTIHVIIPYKRLSSDTSRRREVIEGHFPEHLPTAFDRTSFWHLMLERPSSPYGCYECDPSIREGLTWWREGTRVRDIPAEYKLLNKGIFAVEDQWSVLSWARYFEREGGGIPDEIVLIHLDDHQDMMSPRIGIGLHKELFDLIMGNRVFLNNSESIIRAIQSGAIGKGSILTPLIWAIRKVHVRHLCLREHPCENYLIKKTLFCDEVLSDEKNRIKIELEPLGDGAVCSDIASYRVTPNPDYVFEGLPESAPILLHIDMDYFSNPFDGNSDWRDGNGRHNYSLGQQRDLIDKFILALSGASIIGRIKDVSVCISPSFYPAESWATVIPYLFEKLGSIGIDISYAR